MGSLALVTRPTAEPITLAEAREHCRITHELSDAQLAALILSAREWGQGVTRRGFLPQTWDFSLDEFPCEIELPMAPVTSVTSVKYVDVSGVEQTLSSSAYEVNLRSVVAKIRPATGYAWPATKVTYNAVTVRFVAGYSADHPDLLNIRQALLLHVEAHYDRDSDNFDNLMAAASRLIEPLRIIRL